MNWVSQYPSTVWSQVYWCNHSAVNVFGGHVKESHKHWATCVNCQRSNGRRVVLTSISEDGLVNSQSLSQAHVIRHPEHTNEWVYPAFGFISIRVTWRDWSFVQKENSRCIPVLHQFLERKSAY